MKLRKELIAIANKLDKLKLFQEADTIDSVLKKLADSSEPDDLSQDWSDLSGKTNPGINITKETLGGSEPLIYQPNEGYEGERINYIELTERIGKNKNSDLSNTKRVSISNKKIERILSSSPTVHSKPNGLWYACDNDWLDWLIYSMPKWIGDYVYYFDLNMSNVLRIKNYNEFMIFQKKYGAVANDYKTSNSAIDWPKVSLTYSGIEICPYIYEASSIDSIWYKYWDVASGCIWDPAAINSFKLIAERKEKIRDPVDFPREDDQKNWVWYGW